MRHEIVGDFIVRVVEKNINLLSASVHGVRRPGRCQEAVEHGFPLWHPGVQSYTPECFCCGNLLSVARFQYSIGDLATPFQAAADQESPPLHHGRTTSRDLPIGTYARHSDGENTSDRDLQKKGRVRSGTDCMPSASEGRMGQFPGDLLQAQVES